MSEKNFAFTIPSEAKSLAKVCDLNSMRFSIAGVHVVAHEGTETTAEATDARCLLRAKWLDPEPRDTEGEAIINGADWLKVKPWSKKKKYTPVEVNGGVKFAGMEQSVETREVEGRFPNTRDIYPSSTDLAGGCKVTLSLCVLKPLIEALVGMADKYHDKVTLRLPKPDKDGNVVGAIAISLDAPVSSINSVDGVLMPCAAD